MFTWAYNQLSQSWENALTDTDGQYAELMAGSYSDNQPDFSWIEPFETKIFSQHWYPIGKTGIPCFANLNGAIHWDSEKLVLQMTSKRSIEIVVTDENENVVFSKELDITPGIPYELECGNKVGLTITANENGKNLMKYTEEKPNLYYIPKTTKDMPYHKDVKTAQELYLEGVHVQQYRDPAVLPDVYWKEALMRDSEHIDSLIAMADYCFRKFKYSEAFDYINRAEKAALKYNKRPSGGKLFYIKALLYFVTDKIDKAYDYFYKASWNMDYYSASMTFLAAIDGKRADYDNMLYHGNNALTMNVHNFTAKAYCAIAQMQLNNLSSATKITEEILQNDPLNHLARYVYVMLGKIGIDEFYSALNSDISQTCLDVAIDLKNCGMEEKAKELLCNLKEKSPMVYYAVGDIENAEKTHLNSAFPFRHAEFTLLKNILKQNPTLPMANYYYGCMLYASGSFECAYKHFEATTNFKPNFYIPYRNMAVAVYSHLNGKDSVLSLLKKALDLNPGDGQLIFETVYVMGKTGVPPKERVDFIKANTNGKMRDDICIELARAYNQGGEYNKAIELLENHVFVPCEGGEHAVAEQYMFAHHALGRNLFKSGNYTEAADEFKKAQILPRNLGAGIWNECRFVPHKFYLAKCLDKLGMKNEADEIYDFLLKLKVDYFSNMHLPELPYYLARVHESRGDFYTARAIIDEYLQKWNNDINKECAGYFATTPFFISYCDNAAIARKAYYSYLLGFINRFIGDDEKEKDFFRMATEYDKLNLFYRLEAKN